MREAALKTDAMKVDPVTWDDLDQISTLRPEGWSDISADFKFYIKTAWCNPIKVESGNKIIAVGASISFGPTAWLAHIIVDKHYRRMGVGSFVVNELLLFLDSQGVQTCSLLATESGRPVYEKAGFRRVTDYVFMRRESPWQGSNISPSIVPAKDHHLQDILQLDKAVSGEDRKLLIEANLIDAMVYTRNNDVCGFYLPQLKEGLIVAEDEEAGLALMNVKYAAVDKAVLPQNNKAGVSFLLNNGFVPTQSKGTRMIRGDALHSSFSKMYSRIGGNLG